MNPINGQSSWVFVIEENKLQENSVNLVFPKGLPAEVNEIAPGGLKAVEANGVEIVLCNYDGKIYAIERRCGHMNAPLDLGTLEGYILTCPMHHAQFDITSGEALSGPVPPSLGNEVIPEGIGKYLQYIGMLMSHIKACDLKTYPVKIEKGLVKVEV